MYYNLEFKDIYYWKLVNKENRKVFVKEYLDKSFDLFISPLNIVENDIEYWYDVITNKIVKIRKTYRGIEIIHSSYILPYISFNRVDSVNVDDFNLYEDMADSLIDNSFYCDLLSNMYDIDEIPFDVIKEEEDKKLRLRYIK